MPEEQPKIIRITECRRQDYVRMPDGSTYPIGLQDVTETEVMVPPSTELIEAARESITSSVLEAEDTSHKNRIARIRYSCAGFFIGGALGTPLGLSFGVFERFSQHGIYNAGTVAAGLGGVATSLFVQHDYRAVARENDSLIRTLEQGQAEVNAMLADTNQAHHLHSSQSNNQ